MSARPGLRFRGEHLGRGDRAAQIVEFAVALPLLVVFVVGIFDFSGAFTLKQKLTNAARDAARAAAAEPISDLSAALPVSVNDAFYTIDNYLLANRINDCGITPGGGSVLMTGPPAWKFAASGSALNRCPTAGLTITISRGYYFPATAGNQPAGVDCLHQSAAGQTAVIATCVSIQYGYQWKFGQAANLLGGTPLLPSTITATAVAMNEN
jgi:Flp pilus assembly protein TadG